MRITTIFGANSALAAVLALGLAACQPQGTTTKIAVGNGDIGPASWLAKPEGEGPFPAVVLMHGCGGTERNTSHQTVWRGLNRHAALLDENGHVTLIVDSFGPRRITDGCQRPLAYYSLQVRDAHAAFEYLATLPFVDGERIGFVGFSLGGGTALLLATGLTVDHRSENRVELLVDDPMAEKDQNSYAALVAYYPWCEPSLVSTLHRPVLIMSGEDDNWTPAARCVALASLVEEAQGEHVLEMKVYPDAHHSFDLPMQGPYYVEGMDGRFHTVQGNDAARRHSQARMLRFFAKHLGPTG